MQRSAHATQRPVNHHNLSGEESEAAGGQAGWLENDSADLLVSLRTKSITIGDAGRISDPTGKEALSWKISIFQRMLPVLRL